MSKINDLLKDIQQLINFSIPLIGSMLSGLIMMIVDRICLSKYSENTLAASGPAIFNSTTIIMFFIGIAGITRVFVGQANGKKDENSIAVSSIAGIIIAIAIGIIFVLLKPLIVFIPKLSTRPEIIKALEQDFMQIVPYYGFFMILNSCFGSIYNGILKTRITLVVGVVGNALNAIFTVLFVFGYMGFPELGMKGSAYGTLVASATSSLIYIVLLLRSDIFKSFSLRSTEKTRILFRSVFITLKIGIPSGASQALDEMGQAAFVWIVGNISLAGLMANNVGLAVNYIIVIPLIGLGIATNVMIANIIGSGDKHKISNVIRAAFFIAFIYIALITVLELLFPSMFIMPFVTNSIDQETFRTAVNVIKVLFTYAVAFSFTMILGGALEAAGLTKYVFWIRVVFTWGMSLPIIYFIVKFNMNKSQFVPICWIIGSVFELLIGLTYGVIFYRKGHKQEALV